MNQFLPNRRLQKYRPFYWLLALLIVVLLANEANAYDNLYCISGSSVTVTYFGTNGSCLTKAPTAGNVTYAVGNNCATATNDPLYIQNSCRCCPIAYRDCIRYTNTNSSATSDTFIIGIYKYIVHIRAGAAPVITRNPSDGIKCPGQLYELSSSGTAFPPARVTWQFARHGIDTFTDIQMVDAPLYIFPVTVADSGARFRAVYTNPFGSATTTTATVIVTTKITIWLGKSTDWNSSVNWTCGVPTASTDAIISTDPVIPSVSITYMPLVTSPVSCRNITFTNGGTLQVGTGGALTLYGNVSGTGLTSNNGSVIFAGSTTQISAGFTGADLIMNNTGNVSFTGPVNLSGNLTMNSGGRLTTNASITVNGMLSMLSGYINLGNGNLQANSINGGSANSYVLTGGSGSLVAPVSSATVIFPVGHSAYNPATITNNGNPDIFSLRVYNGVTGDGMEGGIPIPQSTRSHVNTTWLIDDINNAGANIRLKLQFNNRQQDSIYFNMAHAALAHYNASIPAWEDFLAATPSQAVDTLSAGVYSVTNSGITNFSPFTITSSGRNGGQPLPVRLLHFDGKNAGDINKLIWQVEDEQNIDYYQVERSRDANHFEFIKRIPATDDKEYRTDDQSPLAGNNYYRLKMTDLNASYKYSGIVQVSVSGRMKGIKAYPNPVGNILTIEASGTTLSATVILTDINQKEIMRGNFINDLSVLNIETLQPGMYFLRFEDGVKREIIKIIK
jgi:hypothetical protein